MDTNGEKANMETELSTPQSDSFWEVSFFFCFQKPLAKNKTETNSKIFLFVKCLDR